MAKYIYQYENWTNFTWNEQKISELYGEVRYLQGKLNGIMTTIGLSQKEETLLNTFTFDILKSSEIEGEILNYEQVRSSIARRLGINTAGLVPSARNIEGIVEMMLDATQRYELPLTEKRLFGWHNALFPTGYSGGYKIDVARYRSKEMQIVSGAIGKEKVHYEAVLPEFVKSEMIKFLKWLNAKSGETESIIKAGIAHFWFVIIHPFDDGNGRIARTISDMQLARAEKSTQRFYSLSAQILAEKKRYYEILQKVQHSDGDITEWLQFFLNCMKNALLASQNATDRILQKAKFWTIHENTPINERQRLMINKLFDGFAGKLQSSKWAKICKCSQDTAIRDIKDLIEKGILQQEEPGGRSTNYELTRPFKLP